MTRYRRRRHKNRRLAPPGRGVGRLLKKAQRYDLTEYEIYSKLADITKDTEYKKLLKRIAEEEKKHAGFWKEKTKKDEKPRYFKVAFHTLLSKLFGLSFGLKSIEKSREIEHKNYKDIAKEIPEAKEIQRSESESEKQLLKIVDESHLKYVSSMVLGVSDALVELTGALAGLTFALQNTKIIALTGLITGVAASFSMGGSEYLSTKSETNNDGKSPTKAAIYTGLVYFATVAFLVLPYLLFNHVYISLVITLFIALVIIFVFTYYISVAQDVSFKKRFLEMAAISLGVSSITFLIGIIIRKYFKVDI